MNTITQGFIEAGFFAETSCFDSSEFWTEESQHLIHEGQADGDIPSDSDSDDIDESSLASLNKFVADFVAKAGSLLDGLDETRVGHDLYFTYAGHGVGFWETERWPDGIGEKLDAICGQGEIHFSAYQDDSGATKIDIYIG